MNEISEAECTDIAIKLRPVLDMFGILPNTEFKLTKNDEEYKAHVYVNSRSYIFYFCKKKAKFTNKLCLNDGIIVDVSKHKAFVDNLKTYNQFNQAYIR